MKLILFLSFLTSLVHLDCPFFDDLIFLLKVVIQLLERFHTCIEKLSVFLADEDSHLIKRRYPYVWIQSCQVMVVLEE